MSLGTLPWDTDPDALLPQDVQLPAPPRRLHEAQQQIFDGWHRFNVIAAGRRFGKTFFSVKMACWYARHTHWADGTSLKGANVWYVSPTMDLALETVAPMILEELGDEVVQHHKVQNWIQLENGCRIYLKSANRPENLRGRALRFVILDEISVMPPALWETIIRPMLVDKEGHALIIGTPVGKGKLYELYRHACQKTSDWWAGWKFKTVDNPQISKTEVEQAGGVMDSAQFKQEFEADFETGGGNVFAGRSLKTGNYFRGAHYILAVFGSDKPFEKSAIAGTESAMMVVVAHPGGWHIVRAQHGYWSVSETIRRISSAWDEYAPRFLAVSDRAYKASYRLIHEYRKSCDARMSVRYHVINDADDTDRIKWALQSRLKAGRITSGKGKHRNAVADQLQDFPLEYSNSELVQALSYMDQLPQPNFGRSVRERFQMIDITAGY